MVHESGAEYDGPAEITLDRAVHPIDVRLRGEFQPIDGHFHWYGRITASHVLTGVASGTEVTLHTEFGSATGRLSDPDPWGRFRIAGTGRPPF